jgi:hypothetical protein
MVVESVHGTLRTIFLAPAIGDAPARQVGVLTGATLILLVTLATIRWMGLTRTGQLLGIGALWVALTVLFEIALGRFILHLEWGRIASDYDLSSGGLMSPGLICMLLTPWAAARIRNIQ